MYVDLQPYCGFRSNTELGQSVLVSLTFVFFDRQHGKSVHHSVMCKRGVQRNPHDILAKAKEEKQACIKSTAHSKARKSDTRNAISICTDLPGQFQQNIDNSLLWGIALVGHVPCCSPGADIHLIFNVRLKGNVL